jgi:hypothetical protein
MSQENVETLRRLLDAFTARDLDRFAGLTLPRVVDGISRESPSRR